jgi:hypothetical protein
LKSASKIPKRKPRRPKGSAAIAPESAYWLQTAVAKSHRMDRTRQGRIDTLTA